MVVGTNWTAKGVGVNKKVVKLTDVRSFEIKITGAELETYWYADKINQVFPAIFSEIRGEKIFECLSNLPVTKFWSLEDNRTGKFVKLTDAVIIS